MSDSTIDWAAVRPDDPDPTPDELGPDEHSCGEFIGDERACFALAAGMSMALIVVLDLGDMLFCTRVAHPDSPVHIAGGAGRVLARWISLPGDPAGTCVEPEFAPDMAFG